MRTTLDIADDVLQAAKELAHRERKTAGQMLSELARRGLCQSNQVAASGDEELARVFGIQPFPGGGQLVTNEMINRLRDEFGDY